MKNHTAEFAFAFSLFVLAAVAEQGCATNSGSSAVSAPVGPVEMQLIVHQGWHDDVVPNSLEAIRRAYKAGIEFRMFGVNSPDDLLQARNLGAVGFTCNHPCEAPAWARSLNVNLKK